jgi:tyrosine-protein phosphatase SIW14
MNRIQYTVLCVLIGLFACSGCSKKPAPAADPAQFTPAKALSLPGCDNLYQVSETFYRGAQPTAEGFKELEKLGIKTVINLRSLHTDQDELKGTGLKYIPIRMEAWDPETDEVRQFLLAATNPENQPVFVHCQHGADRTGTMTAAWRIVIEGWTKEKAIQEMTEGPFGFHEIWTGLPKFLDKLDLDTLRKEFPKDNP